MKKKQIILNVPDTNPPVDNTVVDFRNWQVGPNCNIKCEEKKIIIYGFELNQYIVKSRYNNPRANLDVHEFARNHSTFNISGLKECLTNNNIVYVPIFNIPNPTAGPQNYQYRGIIWTIGIRGNVNAKYDFWTTFQYPWDFGIPNGYLKNPNNGFSKAGFQVNGTLKLYNNPYNSYKQYDDIQFDDVAQLTCANGQYRIVICGQIDGNHNAYIDCYDNPIILELIE